MRRAGFTLIELLVAATIVALLAIASVAGYSRIQKRSRDSRRIADVGTIGLALENYFSANSSYPSEPSGADGVLVNQSTNLRNGLVVGGYLNVIPSDPKPGNNTLPSTPFCVNYTYASSWTNPTVSAKLFNGVAVGTRQWAIYFRSEVGGNGGTANQNLLDQSLPTFNESYCGDGVGYGLLVGPRL